MQGARDIQTVWRERIVPTGTARHGLVIGIGDYRDSRLNLRHARADAQAVYDLMVDPSCGLFEPEHVKLLLDAEASRDHIHRALSQLCRQAGAQDTVWLYYAGHGAIEDSRSYWVAHDSEVDDLRGTALSGRELADFLNDIASERLLVWLDCCHAAATAARKNATRDVLRPEDAFAAFPGKGRLTICSSDGRQQSAELSEVGHGAFTHFLVQGLRGMADVDEDGMVTVDELWKFLRTKVAEASRTVGVPQTPMLIGEWTHDFALTLNHNVTVRKSELAEGIARLAGLGADRLSTDEAEYCLQLLQRGAHTPSERELAAEFPSLLNGSLKLTTFRRLLEYARERSAPAVSEQVRISDGTGYPEVTAAPPSRRPPELEFFTQAKDLLVSQAKWRAFLGCPELLRDASGLEFVLVPAGRVSLDLGNGGGPEWVGMPRPYWVSRQAADATVMRGLFQMAAEQGWDRFGKLLGTTTFLRCVDGGFAISAEDVLSLCDFMGRQWGGCYRLPSELEWIAGVSLFTDNATGNRRRTCLGVEQDVRHPEWTGSHFGPWRSAPTAGLLVPHARTAVVVRRTSPAERRMAGSAIAVAVGGVRLVKEIDVA